MSLKPSDAVSDSKRITRYPVASELGQVIYVVQLDSRAQEDMTAQIPPRRDGHMLLEMIGGGTAPDLSAGLVVIGEEAQACDSDACAEFRHQPLRGEPGRSKNGINVIEYRTVWNTSIIAFREIPRYFQANAYMLSHENGRANVTKQAPHAGRFVKVAVTKRIDLGAV
jgi:hypothetical protein